MVRIPADRKIRMIRPHLRGAVLAHALIEIDPGPDGERRGPDETPGRPRGVEQEAPEGADTGPYLAVRDGHRRPGTV